MYNTRNNEKCNLKIETIRTHLGKQSISCSRAVIWNNIPTKLRNTISDKRLCRDLIYIYSSIKYMYKFKHDSNFYKFH